MKAADSTLPKGNEGEGKEGGEKPNTLYLKNHYGIRQLFQGANKILNYSSSVQLIPDSLKEKSASQCNRATITT